MTPKGLSDSAANAGKVKPTTATTNTVVVTGIQSVPPKGSYKVINLYVDPKTGKLVVQYDDGR